ncbi:MAG: hypothetical protein LQ346_005329 [Caloplaca aetnensis]|nr:MAG: hypothetical protein LQ346_005329 [Caloplaca aetnensis]
MCFGQCIIYAKCNHHKHNVESPCNAGLNAQRNCIAGRWTTTRRRTSDKPSLCVNCYRRHVDDIIALYRQKIKRCDQAIAGITEVLETAHDSRGNRELEEAMSDLEIQRGDFIDERYEKLEEFRIQQGVWGDGGIFKGYRPFGTPPADE